MVLAIKKSSETIGSWPRRRCAIFAVFIFAIGLIIFEFAYIGMRENIGIGAFNQPLLSWMIEHRNPQITNIMKIVSDIVNPLDFTIIITLIAGFWAIIKREAWRPVLLVGAMALTTATATVLKIITINSRPLIANMIQPPETDYSFPSGHTITVAVFLLVLGYLIVSRRSSAVRIWVWTIVTILGTMAIATSRLYLGYHWLTDVVASLALGLIILSIVICADIIVRRQFKN